MIRALLIVPFWGNVFHVGNYRVERFIRWLRIKDISVVLVKAGLDDNCEEHEWGIEITIRDKFIFYGHKIVEYLDDSHSNQYPSWIKRIIAKVFLAPDQTVVWARKIVKNRLILEKLNNISYIISSSPPESVHVAAFLLSNKCKAKLIVDLRDGWLDEPLNKTIDMIPFRKRYETIIERKILDRADKIITNSEVWKEMLNTRIPSTKKKTFVLTNGYPEQMNNFESTRYIEKNNGKITLIHTGQFTGSSPNRKIQYILEPILQSIVNIDCPGEIILLGNLTKEDLFQVQLYRDKFKEFKWGLSIIEQISRDEMLGELMKANGLILLSTSRAAIPSKLFEYLPTKKPILAFTPEKSSVWRICENLPQVTLVDYLNKEQYSLVTTSFFFNCKSMALNLEIPDQFHEEYLKRQFFKILEI